MVTFLLPSEIVRLCSFPNVVKILLSQRVTGLLLLLRISANCLNGAYSCSCPIIFVLQICSLASKVVCPLPVPSRMSWLDTNMPVLACFLDATKAFNLVNHDLLFQLTEAYQYALFANWYTDQKLDGILKHPTPLMSLMVLGKVECSS